MKSVLIVGGNSDIGFGVAKAFAKNRFNVHLASRNVNQMKIKKFYIDNNFDVNCKVSFLDITNKKIINNFFNKKLTCPDVLVISSGFMEKYEKNICDLINVNFSSPVKFIEFFLKKFSKKNLLKTIIGISSVAGEIAKKKNNIYSASKSGFSNYLDGLRHRLYSRNIHVITVKPGYVNTKMVRNLRLPRILLCSSDYAGEKIYNAFLINKNILFVPSVWYLIIKIYKIIPEIFFKFLYKNKE